MLASLFGLASPHVDRAAADEWRSALDPQPTGRCRSELISNRDSAAASLCRPTPASIVGQDVVGKE
jgi:hypothetical protein